VPVDRDRFLFAKHLIDRRLIVDRTLERGPHRDHHQSRPGRIERLFEFAWDHLPGFVGFDQPKLQVLKIREPLDGIMRFLRDITDGPHPGLAHKLTGPEIHPVIVSVRAAHGHDPPSIVCGKAIERSEEIDHFILKLVGVHADNLGFPRIADIVHGNFIEFGAQVPVVEFFEVGILVDWIPHGFQPGFVHPFGKLIQPLERRVLGRKHSGLTKKTEPEHKSHERYRRIFFHPALLLDLAIPFKS